MLKKYTDDLLDSLIEEATVDCYDEEESRMGFATILEESLETPFKAKLSNQIVTVTKIEGGDRLIKVFIQKNGMYPVDILELEVSPRIKGSEWIAAYRKWEGGE